MKSILLFLVCASFAFNACSTPQTSTTSMTMAPDGRPFKMIDGKPYVWVAGELGSNVPARWVPADSPAAQAASSSATQPLSTSQLQNLQTGGR